MLSQGRVKPNSATRVSVPPVSNTTSVPSGSAGGTGSTTAVLGGGGASVASYVAPQRLLMEAKAAAVLRSSAPEPFAPPLTHNGGQQAGGEQTNLVSHRMPTTGGAGGGVGRSTSSLAVAHQEYSAQAGFPARHSAGGQTITSPAQSPGNGGASGTTGRKGVAPINARPVPVSHSAEPHVPHSSGASYTSPGPVLSNTARHQQQQIIRVHQQQAAPSPTSAATPPLVHNNKGGVGVSGSVNGRRTSASNSGRNEPQTPTSSSSKTQPPSNHHRRTLSSSDDGGRSGNSSSADSSENSPTSAPLAPPSSSGGAAAALANQRSKAPDDSNASRVMMNVAAEFGAGGGKMMSPRGGDEHRREITDGDPQRGSHRDIAFAASDSDDGMPTPTGPQPLLTTKPNHQAQKGSVVQQPDTAEAATVPTGSISSQRQATVGAPKRTTSSTPTPPPPAPTSASATKKSTPGKTSTSTASSSSPSASSKPPQIDIGPACQSLSLYDAFTFDPALKMWVVRDDVLSKCLEYIRIMGYQHPAYARALRDPPPSKDAAGGGALPNTGAYVEKLKMPSIWCSSSTIPTPIVAAATPPVVGAVKMPLAGSASTSSGTTSPAVASPTVPAAAKLNDERSPPLNNGPQWKLVPLKTPTPPDVTSAPIKTTSSEDEKRGDEDELQSQHAPLFFECEESLRWLAEQEYVIGTILLTCSFEPMSTTEKRAKMNLKKHQQQQHPGSSGAADESPTKSSQQPLVRRQYVPSHTHPIRYVAAHVIHNFSHWGDFKSFSSVWDAQVRLVLGVAQPSHQKVIPVPETGLVFSSEFECGNLARVQRHVQGAYNNPFAQNGVCPPGTSTNVYLLWIEGDTQSDKRLWFRFAVSGCRAREPLCLRMMNIAPNARLYRNGMKPVWRAGASQLQWTAVDDYTFHVINDDRDGELSFYIIPKSSFETIHVAFCVPYSYGDLLCHITQWHAIVKRSACNIRFEERVLCRTLDERKLHLLIITSQTEKISGKQQHQQLDSRGRPIQQSGSTPYSVFASGKKVILVSGRVHPGEVTASHAVHGIVSFLLSHDPRAATLREHFIFFVVPMLNPDGVARGYSRLDQNGLNLNRCYNDPNPVTQPTVHSLRNVFDHLQTNFRDRFFMYLDFHSHASQSSGFAFGNHLPNSVQHWNMLFPRLIAVHSNDLFDFDTCRFSRGHMVSKDGTSRVLFGGSLIHSYTIELTHFTDFKTFGDRHPTVPPAATVPAVGAVESGSGKSSKNPPGKGSKESDKRDKESPSGDSATASNSGPAQLQSPVINSVLCHSAEVGRACVLALLDYCSIGDPSTDLLKFGSMERVIREVKREIRGGGPQRPSSYNSSSSFKQY